MALHQNNPTLAVVSSADGSIWQCLLLTLISFGLQRWQRILHGQVVAFFALMATAVDIHVLVGNNVRYTIDVDRNEINVFIVHTIWLVDNNTNSIICREP